VLTQVFEKLGSNSNNTNKDFEFYMKKYMSKLKEDKLWVKFNSFKFLFYRV